MREIPSPVTPIEKPERITDLARAWINWLIAAPCQTLALPHRHDLRQEGVCYPWPVQLPRGDSVGIAESALKMCVSAGADPGRLKQAEDLLTAARERLAQMLWQPPNALTLDVTSALEGLTADLVRGLYGLGVEAGPLRVRVSEPGQVQMCLLPDGLSSVSMSSDGALELADTISLQSPPAGPAHCEAAWVRRLRENRLRERDFLPQLTVFLTEGAQISLLEQLYSGIKRSQRRSC